MDTTKPSLAITYVNAVHSVQGTYTPDVDFDSKHIFKHINDGVIIYHFTGYEKDTKYLAKLATDGYGYTCTDTCDATPNVTTKWYINITTSEWIAVNYDNTQPGTYKLEYECIDLSGNSASKSRTVMNEDRSSLMYITQEFSFSGDRDVFLGTLVLFFRRRGAYFFTYAHIDIFEMLEARRRLG